MSYPKRETVMYGRGVWPLGENGDEFVVEGHDARALAALAGYFRDISPELYDDLHNSLRYTDYPAQPQALWMTWTDSCGCSDGEHIKHIKIAELKSALPPCPHASCELLPPCVDDPDVLWRARWHRDPNALPKNAVPVLLW